LALTAVTPYMVRQEVGDAVALASELGIRHELVEMDMPEGMDHNPKDRCLSVQGVDVPAACGSAPEELGYTTLMDASNLDDLEQSPSALRAVGELGIRTPLIDLEIDKAGVRETSRAAGLSTWRKPSNACLLTRFRHERTVSMPELQRIEEAERLLQAKGYESVRVRCHDGLARIEVAPEQRLRLMEEAEQVGEALTALGFRYVALDLFGYHHGSMAAGPKNLGYSPAPDCTTGSRSASPRPR
jgi:uncharacterized protein